MLFGVDYVRSICEQRKIPISQLEQACEFSNGYLNPKKLKKVPYDRAIAMAKYLNVPVEPILGEVSEDAKKEPAAVVSDKLPSDFYLLSEEQQKQVTDYIAFLLSQQ